MAFDQSIPKETRLSFGNRQLFVREIRGIRGSFLRDEIELLPFDDGPPSDKPMKAPEIYDAAVFGDFAKVERLLAATVVGG